ncbi:MAG: hypothetical protein ACTSQE_08015 [Candidatus Heimdallarchaeaceae archaeon]
MKIYNSSGVVIKDKDWEISCDITKHRNTSLLFISHAHSDHITKRPPENATIICSKITEALFKHFVSKAENIHCVEEYEWNGIKYSQLPSGHAVGSTALKIETSDNTIIYTGDVSIREKGFTEPYKPQKCDILIVESTFGESRYSFPPIEDEITRAKELIQGYMDDHIPVILMGYAYGKAQLLYHHFARLSDTIVLHG